MENPNKVDTGKLRKEIRYALQVCSFVYMHRNGELVLYHTDDGEHMEGSLHYKNRAVDVSLPSQDVDAIVEEIRLFLEPEYDVIVESDHLHVEWDPK
jgi:hypothetical protein